MNKKTLYLLATAFIVLLAVATLPWWREYVPGMGSTNQSVQVYVPEPIVEVVFYPDDQEDRVSLTKSDELTWQVNDHRAQLGLVNQLLDDLNNLTIGSVVSTNPDRFATFQASDTGRILEVKNNTGEIQRLSVGKRALEAGSIYLRDLEQAEVWLVKSNLTDYFNRSVEDWRDKVILNLDTQEIEQIKLSLEGQTYIIDQTEEGDWQAQIGQETRVLGEVATERLLDQLESLEGIGFVAESEQSEYLETLPTATLEIQLADGATHMVNFWQDQTDESWVAQSDESEELVELSSAVYTTIIDNTQTLLQE